MNQQEKAKQLAANLGKVFSGVSATGRKDMPPTTPEPTEPQTTNSNHAKSLSAQKQFFNKK